MSEPAVGAQLVADHHDAAGERRVGEVATDEVGHGDGHRPGTACRRPRARPPRRWRPRRRSLRRPGSGHVGVGYFGSRFVATSRAPPSTAAAWPARAAGSRSRDGARRRPRRAGIDAGSSSPATATAPAATTASVTPGPPQTSTRSPARTQRRGGGRRRHHVAGRVDADPRSAAVCSAIVADELLVTNTTRRPAARSGRWPRPNRGSPAGQPHDAVEITQHHVRPFHDGRRYPRECGTSVAGAASLCGCRGSNRSPPCATAPLSLDDVIAPPYDVLSATDSRRVAARDEHNIVHVDVPAPADGRTATNTRRRLRDVDRRRHAGRGRRRRRSRSTGCASPTRPAPNATSWASSAALEVVDEGAGGVLPHERTTPKASTDRLDLTRATDANLSPVWGLSLATRPDRPARRPGRADRRGHRRRGRTHRRAGDRPDRIAAIARCVGSDDVLIADGHHRYGISRDLPRRGRAADGAPDRRPTDAGLRRRTGRRAAEHRGDPPPVHGVALDASRALGVRSTFAARRADAGDAGRRWPRRVPGARRAGRHRAG